jgi:hypothetical protein
MLQEEKAEKLKLKKAIEKGNMEVRRDIDHDDASDDDADGDGAGGKDSR